MSLGCSNLKWWGGVRWWLAPMRAGRHRRRSDAGPPSFQCSPFARDVLFDPGRMARPRLTAMLMLRSTISTVSAPATYPFRGSITYPTQLLCTLRGRRCRRLTQHSLPGGPLRPYPDRSFTGWTAPASLAPSEILANRRQAGSGRFHLTRCRPSAECIIPGRRARGRRRRDCRGAPGRRWRAGRGPGRRSRHRRAARASG